MRLPSPARKAERPPPQVGCIILLKAPVRHVVIGSA
jgi:hypothetical protein